MKLLLKFTYTLLIISQFSCGGSSEEKDSSEALVYQLSVNAMPDYYNSQFMNTLPLNSMGTGIGGPDTNVNSIEGFEHKFGTQYVIEIQSTPERVNGTNISRKELVRTISANRDPIGTTYTYPSFELVGDILKLENGNYLIPPYEFFCADGVDCESLLSISNDGGLVSLEFTLVENLEVPIALTSWQ